MIGGASAFVLKYTMGDVLHTRIEILTNIISRVIDKPDIKLSMPASAHMPTSLHVNHMMAVYLSNF